MTELVPPERVKRTADPVATPPGSMTPAAPPSGGPDAKAPAKTGGTRKLVMGALVIGVIALGARYGYHYWTDGRFMVSTDDAYVKADMSTIAAKVGGYVTKVAVTENQRVAEGDLLAQIDPVDYRLAVEAAQGRVDTQTATIARITAQLPAQRAAIDQSHAMVASANVDQALAAKELERARTLASQLNGTQQRLDQAAATFDRAKASVQNVQAQVAASEANLTVLQAQLVEAERTRSELQTALERTKRDLDFATVRAPFDGIVGNKTVQTGLLVQPGSRLLTLVPPETAYVEANFKETQLAALRAGQKVSVHVDARSNQAIEGVVESFAPASGAQFSMLPPENATGNFTKIVQRLPVRVRVPLDVARSGILAPGMSVVVDVDTRTGPKDDAGKGR